MKILVIKLGALGDMVLSFPFFKALKENHPTAEISVLTTPVFKELLEETPFFDHILTCPRKGGDFFALTRTIRKKKFDLIIDFQLVERTTFWGLFFTAFSKTKWLGCGVLEILRHKKKLHSQMHAFDRLNLMFKRWGLKPVAENLAHPFEKKELEIQGLKKPYALFAIGASLTYGGGKIWPLSHFQRIADALVEKGILPVVLGGTLEKDKIVKGALNLIEKTTLKDIFLLADHACFCLSNDTGAGHIFATTSTPTLILYSKHTNPIQCAPRAKTITTLQKDTISDITPSEVLDVMRHLAIL